jgi:hypothetical protein
MLRLRSYAGPTGQEILHRWPTLEIAAASRSAMPQQIFYGRTFGVQLLNFTDAKRVLQANVTFGVV